MAAEWATAEITVLEYRDTGTFVIKLDEAVLQQLDDHIGARPLQAVSHCIWHQMSQSSPSCCCDYCALLWLHFAHGSEVILACTATWCVTSPQALLQKLVHASQALLDLRLLILCCRCIALITPLLSAITSNIMAFLVPTVSFTAQLHVSLSPHLADKHAWVCLQS